MQMIAMIAAITGMPAPSPTPSGIPRPKEGVLLEGPLVVPAAAAVADCEPPEVAVVVMATGLDVCIAEGDDDAGKEVVGEKADVGEDVDVGEDLVAELVAKLVAELDAFTLKSGLFA